MARKEAVGRERVVEPLIRILGDGAQPIEVRRQAVESLGALYSDMRIDLQKETDRAVQACVDGNDDPELGARYFVLRQEFGRAAEFGEAAIQPLLSLFCESGREILDGHLGWNIFYKVVQALKKIGPAVIPATIEALPEARSEWGKYMLQVLGHFTEDPRVPAVLIGSLRPYALRGTAVEQLSKFPGEEVTAALRHCLDDTLRREETDSTTVALIKELKDRKDVQSIPLFETAVNYTGGIRGWISNIQAAAREALGALQAPS